MRPGLLSNFAISIVTAFLLAGCVESTTDCLAKIDRWGEGQRAAIDSEFEAAVKNVLVDGKTVVTFASADGSNSEEIVLHPAKGDFDGKQDAAATAKYQNLVRKRQHDIEQLRLDHRERNKLCGAK